MRKSLCVLAISAAAAAFATTGGSSQAAMLAPSGIHQAIDGLRLTETEAVAIVGTTTAGGARVGTDVAFVFVAAWARMVRSGGADGDGRVIARSIVQ